MNKNNMRKRFITGAVAATLIIGGASYMQSQAFAAADTSTAAPSTGAGAADGRAAFEGRGHGHRGGMGSGLVESTAELLGVESGTIMTQLQAGQTFAEIAEAAGLSKTDYLAKLIAAETAKIDEKLAAGSITAEQADAKKAALTEKLTQAIETNAPALGGRGHGRGGHHGFGRFGSSEETAAAIGVTEDELRAALESGQSLAELAAAQGISEADLIAKLKDAMTDELKTFVNEKRSAKQAPAADAAAAEAAAAGASA
jgi:hypothetical protein